MVVASKACSICMLAHHRIDVMPNMIMIGYLVSRYRDPDHIIASGNCCSQLMMMYVLHTQYNVIPASMLYTHSKGYLRFCGIFVGKYKIGQKVVES